MADDDISIPIPLQRLVLAALAFDTTHGAAIAAQVKPANFDAVYRDFAARILSYRRQHRKPPGVHVADLAEQSNLGREQKLKLRLLTEIKAEAKGLNAEYIAKRASDFVRRQTVKAALVQAGDRFMQDDERMVGDIEHIFHQVLHSRQHTMDAGLHLDDPRALVALDERTVYPLGIKELDRLGIGPSPKTLLLYIAAKNTGKSWFCVHVGRQCVLNNAKVVHVSCEMDRFEVIERYYKTFFALSDKPEQFEQIFFVHKCPSCKFANDNIARKCKKCGEPLYGNDLSYKVRKFKPALTMRDAGIQSKLLKEIKSWRGILGNLVVIDFPTRSLTIEQLTGFLDYLEAVEGFVTNVLIVDYPDLMMVDSSNYRLGIGDNFEMLRGVAVQRNLALVAPTQSTRATYDASWVKGSQAAEDIRKVNASDIVLTYSRTPAEKLLGLSRLSVEFVRRGKSGRAVLLSQNYATGQYVLDSKLWNKKDRELTRELAGKHAGNREEEEGDSGDIVGTGEE